MGVNFMGLYANKLMMYGTKGRFWVQGLEVQG